MAKREKMRHEALLFSLFAFFPLNNFVTLHPINQIININMDDYPADNYNS